ncbi:MAG: GspE/PulE family protein, partial [bacterium]|nr:GspE/PulE family protein [bacterium]
MTIPVKSLRDALVVPGHIAEADFERAVKEAEHSGMLLERVIVENGMIRDENLGLILADILGSRYVDLHKVKIFDEVLRIIPEQVAKYQQAVSFEITDDTIRIATVLPDNYEFFKLLEKKTGKKIEAFYTTQLGLEEVLRFYKRDLNEQVEKLIRDLESNPKDEQNIVRLVAIFLEYAHDSRASDIHFEPTREHVVVRFRVDGVLQEVSLYPKTIHEKVVIRIKILSRLRTDEHAIAQDGRFTYTPLEEGEQLVLEDWERVHTDSKPVYQSQQFDVRVSIMPVVGGENIVMRLLAVRTRRLTLEELGIADRDLIKLQTATKKPFGMVLASGPTGSGKTTTLYAILQILNRTEVNIMTIEDPIEYEISAIRQSQVNQKKDFTFANGLRSIVRQDPDIIMVGEIRDNETADIAVNAALTGHLLLSTLHANDSSTTLLRLIEMGVEPFLIASSVNT